VLNHYLYECQHGYHYHLNQCANLRDSQHAHKSCRDQAVVVDLGMVDAWASKLKVTPRFVRVQRMTRKWGSCSARGTITLAADLTEQDRHFQDFVVAHELLHLRVPNHGRLFKALMTACAELAVIRCHPRSKTLRNAPTGRSARSLMNPWRNRHRGRR
jgi:predicted metal-dependent hydrolase